HRHLLHGRQRCAAAARRLRISDRIRDREDRARSARASDPGGHQRDHGDDRRQDDRRGDEDEMTVIAFIGAGHMGGPMAANLVRAGHTVRGADPDPAARETAAGHGIETTDSAAAAVAGAEAVITMLPSGEILRAVYAEAVPAAAAGALFIDCSTVAVDDARAAADTARAAGLEAVDAPVSGGVVGAAAATLTFMVGGTDAAVERARPLLEAMGKKVVHCGDSGAGQAAKICNNMILGISMVAVSEAFVLGEKLGLSHQALYDVASAASEIGRASG